VSSVTESVKGVLIWVLNHCGVKSNKIAWNLLHLLDSDTVVSCTLKMKAASSSEMPVIKHKTTQCHNAEDHNQNTRNLICGFEAACGTCCAKLSWL
jgi:hypothetical protein